MAATTSNNAGLLKTLTAPGYVEAVYRNNDLYRALGFTQAEKHIGGATFGWSVNSAGSTAAVFSEGETLASKTQNTFVRAAVSPVAVWSPIEITSHLMAAASSGGATVQSVVDVQLQLALADIRDLLNTSFLGGTYGLELAVDYGSSYAGITRNGSAGYFEAIETAVDGVLTLANLVNLREGLLDNDRGASPNNLIWIMPYNQITNYENLNPNTTSTLYVQQMISANDKGNPAPATFKGAPIYGCGDMTDTVIIGLDIVKAAPRLIDFPLYDQAEFAIVPREATSSGYAFELCSAKFFVLSNPKFSGKLTGVTA